MCVCVCVRERERELERNKEREDSTLTGSVSLVQLVNLWVAGGNSNQIS